MSDAAFDDAVALVLRHEGGYVNDGADPGGETNFGISKRNYPDLDITSLTREQAIAIYRRDWWERYGYGRLADAIAVKTFDLAVNLGPATAHKLLQTAVQSLGQDVGVDGRLGPESCAAANRCDAAELRQALRDEAAAHYRHLAERNPALAKFLGGWLARAAE